VLKLLPDSRKNTVLQPNVEDYVRRKGRKCRGGRRCCGRRQAERATEVLRVSLAVAWPQVPVRNLGDYQMKCRSERAEKVWGVEKSAKTWKNKGVQNELKCRGLKEIGAVSTACIQGLTLQEIAQGVNGEAKGEGKPGREGG